ncbi:MAG: hypothetical protein EOO38_21130 [Cytophagaceae bacterium]|nr:MAG: hypothetical protein EOO38_21130 [Cytophagaceae bacterium]
MRAEELRARPTPRTPVDVDDVFNIPGLDTTASALELAEAGMSIDDGSNALSILDDDSEPSSVDLGDNENELLGGEDLLSSFSDDE